jgi:hypothetical protein
VRRICPPQTWPAPSVPPPDGPRLSIDLQHALNALQTGRATELLRRLIRALLSETRTLDTLGEALAERIGGAPVVHR